LTGNPKREGALPWLVEVFPLGNLDGSIDHHFKDAAVFITDPEKKEVISTKGMQALFELTDVEAEICASLLRDCRLIRSLRAATAALAPCVAKIKMLYSKTGTSGHADLVCFALKVNLPVAHNRE